MDKKIGLFILAVLLLSWLSVLGIQFFHLSQSPMTVVMIFPMVLAFLFILFSKDKIRAVGWNLPRWDFLLLSLFLPIFQIALTLAAGNALGLLSYNSQHIIAHRPTGNVWLNLALCLPGMFIPFILLSFPRFLVGWLNHLGEEFAWRGYLFRKISEQRASIQKGVIISGLVWWAWHLPMFWLSPVLVKLKLWQLGLTVVVSCLGLIGTATVYSWVYIRSGSIWSPTIMHLSWNLFRGILTGRLADGEPGLFKGNLWLVNGEGIIGNMITALVGIFFFILIVRLDKNIWSKNQLRVQ